MLAQLYPKSNSTPLHTLYGCTPAHDISMRCVSVILYEVRYVYPIRNNENEMIKKWFLFKLWTQKSHWSQKTCFKPRLTERGGDLYPHISPL
jgi:hypothetical protein